MELPLRGENYEAFNDKNFSAQQFVKNISNQAITVNDLLSQHQAIQSLSDDTNSLLKKNVYQNYRQFIETAKEIAYLEGEMYQLSQLLNEQKTLLATMMDSSLTKPASRMKLTKTQTKKKDDRQEKLEALALKVEDCNHIIEKKDRILLYEESLVELDTDTHQAIHRIHGYLMNDGLMITTWITNRRGPMRHKFQKFYEIDNLPIVNVRDMLEVKHAFKLMMVDEVRLFQCATSDSKKLWLSWVDKAKSKCYELLDDTSVIEQDNEDRNPENIFPEEVLPSKSKKTVTVQDLPEWILEYPDDIECYIAQRDFEEAVALHESVNKFISSNESQFPINSSTRKTCEDCYNHLVEVLKNELRVFPEKSLQGGPKASRRAAGLLIKLGKSTEACELVLDRRTAILKMTVKQVRVEGNTLGYIRRLTTIFFKCFKTCVKEYEVIFGWTVKTTPYLVMWVHQEVHKYMSIFANQVMTEDSKLSTVGACTHYLRTHLAQLSDLGLDIACVVEEVLHPKLLGRLNIARAKQLEAIKFKASDDRWTPYHLKTKDSVNKILQELTNLGIKNPSMYLLNDLTIVLTYNVFSFTKTFIALVEDVSLIHCEELKDVCDNLLVSVFQEQMKVVSSAISNPSLKAQSSIIERNHSFLLDVVLSLVETQYEAKLGCPSEKIGQLVIELTTGFKRTESDGTAFYTTTEYV